ncbi:MAG: ABC transporter ATP-binding protein, partial [Polyangiales bacterium]
RDARRRASGLVAPPASVTLLKIAGGVETADSGRVMVMGRPLVPVSPREAIRRGVAMVHQHFMLVPTLTGLENLSLGDEPTRMGLLDLRAREAEIQALADGLELPVRLDVPTESLSVGERQRLELLRALRTRPKVLILDEPTAVLAPREAEAVLGLARRLADDGVAVALVTHHLDEVAAWSDEITVLRRGAIVAHHAPGDAAISDVHLIAREALGEDVPQIARDATKTGEIRLAIRGLHVTAGEGAPLRGLDLEIRAGEIVGVAGVEGNGQHALELALAGLASASSGTIALDGVDVTGASVHERRARGLSFIASDRHAHGIAELPAKDVVRLGALSEVARSGIVDENALREAFAGAVSAFDVRPDAPDQLATSFSGGNQQKLVVARELRGSPKVVIAAQPTRGVDLRAATRIRRALLDIAKRGAAVLVISTDLDELRAVSARIVVLRQGRVAAVLPPDAGLDRIGEAMMGAS